jgi:glutamate carboxypeptidase
MTLDVLDDRFRDLVPEAVCLLKTLVECESHSLDKAGVDDLASLLAGEFELRGAAVRLLDCRSRGNALRADIGCSEAAPVLLLGHLDTVWPRGTTTRRPFRVEAGRAFGPGVFDMKAGLLLCLLVCDAVESRWVQVRRPIRFLFTADEELGTETGIEHLRTAADGCAAVLCLEPPLPGGAAKTSRKGVGVFRIRVRGLAAHAGVNHERGANAIVELSRQLVHLQEMTDYSRGTTLSVGTVRGGLAANVVPDEAEASVDFRVSSLEDADVLVRAAKTLQPVDRRCTIEVEGGLERPPLVRNASVIALFETARSAALESGFVLKEGSTGGGSDGSFTAAMGIPTLDGLGVEGDGAHAEHEHVLIEDIPRRAAFLARTVAAL